MQWNFPVEPGNYTVNLYFAEIGTSQQAVGAARLRRVDRGHARPRQLRHLRGGRRVQGRGEVVHASPATPTSTSTSPSHAEPDGRRGSRSILQGVTPAEPGPDGQRGHRPDDHAARRARRSRGTASDDGLPAGSTLTTTWSKFSGPGTVTFGNANQLEHHGELLASPATYVLRLTASDGTLSTTDDVTITVNAARDEPGAGR